jgi:UDP-glucose 4-epimerase
MSKELCLVLGADGFLGSYVTEYLLEKGYSVRAFDIYPNGKASNLNHIINKIDVFQGNFLKRKDINEALKDVSFVFHYISTTIPSTSIRKPIYDIQSNVVGTARLLDLCLKHNVRKIVFSSSGGTIYGETDKISVSEKDITHPITPYGINKLTIEKYLHYYSYHYGLDYLICRYSNPYGPRQGQNSRQGIIPIFLSQIKRNKPLNVFGFGDIIRDYLYIDDCMETTMKLFEKNDIRFNLYNVGSGVGLSINDLIKEINLITNKNFQIEYHPARVSDLRRIVLNVERAEKEVGKIVNTNITDGISKVWKYITDYTD